MMINNDDDDDIEEKKKMIYSTSSFYYYLDDEVSLPIIAPTTSCVCFFKCRVRKVKEGGGGGSVCWIVLISFAFYPDEQICLSAAFSGIAAWAGG